MFYRLGQACNHIAALLFYVEYHAKDDELPTDKSITSKPMVWNQPPKKSVNPASASTMTFVKPSHGDNPRSEEIHQTVRRSTFDPRLPQHRALNMDSVHKLIGDVKASIPCTGLQQFWLDKPSNESLNLQFSASLWNLVIFSHEKVSSIVHEKFLLLRSLIVMAI